MTTRENKDGHRGGYLLASHHFGRARSRFLHIRRPRPHRLYPACMATDQELSDFLASVERRAFKQAVFAVRDDEAALDIFQDAIIQLAEK